MKRKLYKIIYSKKYQKFGCHLQGRHCIIIKQAKGKKNGAANSNCLVQIRGNKFVIIPWGNLKATQRYTTAS